MDLNGTDPVLNRLRYAAQRLDDATREIRLLIAYARELTTPRPYTLAVLAEAADMSISGVRTAYGSDEIEVLTSLFGPSGPDCAAQLLNAFEEIENRHRASGA